MDSFKLLLKILVPIFLMIVAIFALTRINETKAIKENREKVYSLIGVGQNPFEAQDILTNHGYKLLYDEPIDLTKQGEFLTQLVIIGNPMPNIADTIFYVFIGGGSPLRSESPYVVIESRMNGEITSIE